MLDESVVALAEGCAVLVLGGDCTIGLGAIAALLSAGEDPGVVYLDLHADINLPSSVTDGALDWMGFGHALDLPGALPAVAPACALEHRLRAAARRPRRAAPRPAGGDVTITEHNPLHGASDGSGTRRLANALADACTGL